MLHQLGASSAQQAAKEEALTAKESQAVGAVRGAVWRNMLATLGDSTWAGHALGGALLAFGLMLLASVLPLGQQWLMSRMGASGVEGDNLLTPAVFFAAFALLTVVILAVSYIAQATFRRACAHAAQQAHDHMLGGVMHSPLRFFETTPSGRVMNRFSADIQVLDIELASRGFRFVQGASTAVASALGVVAVTWLAALPFSVATWAAVKVARLYGTAVRENARLASITRSPVFSLFNDCLRGHSTLRAFGREAQITRALDAANHLSLNTELRRWELAFWLSARLILVSCGVMVFLLLPLVLGGRVAWMPALGAGTLGLLLALTYGLMGRIERLCRDYFGLATVLVPWERCQQWAELPPEEPAAHPGVPTEPDAVPADWPQQGRIDFQQACLRYAPELPAIVEDASFTVPARSHVALLGRTGAGKSTVVLALLRTLHVSQGRVLIDGVDIQQVPHTRLRQAIAYVPQDPVLFLGPLRDSLGRDRRAQRRPHPRRVGPHRPGPLHRQPAARPGHAAGGRRTQHQRRPKAADLPGARHAVQDPHHPDGRGHRQRGRGDRPADTRRHPAAAARHHHFADRPPAQLAGAVRPVGKGGTGADGGGCSGPA